MHGRKVFAGGLFVKGRMSLSLFLGIGPCSGFSAVGLGRMRHCDKKVVQKTYGVYRKGFAEVRRVVGVDAAGAQILAGEAGEALGKERGKLGAQVYYFAFVLAQSCAVQADKQQAAFHKATLPARAADSSQLDG